MLALVRDHLEVRNLWGSFDGEGWIRVCNDIRANKTAHLPPRLTAACIRIIAARSRLCHKSDAQLFVINAVAHTQSLTNGWRPPNPNRCHQAHQL